MMRRCRQQGSDRHRDRKPADEYSGDRIRRRRDIQPNCTDLPGDGRSDWVDSTRCNEPFALLT